MRLPELGKRGQSAAVGMQLTLIITLIVAIIIVYQLGVAGVAPTPYPWMDENGELSLNYDNVENMYANPNYDADARTAYDRTITLAWAGISLMAVAIIILAASVILSIVRGPGGV